MAEEKQEDKQKIVICGAGNAAHIFCGLAASNPKNDVHILSLYATEAADFKTALDKTDDKLLTIDIKAENKKIKSKPSNITNDPSCLQGADIIIISLPAFAHGQYVQAIKDNIKLPKDSKKKILVSAWPGGAGLECEWSYIIGKSPNFALMSGRTLPWAARIVKFGQSAEILGTKDQIEAALDLFSGDEQKESDKERKVYYDKIENMIGKKPVIIDTGHIFNMSLAVVGSIVHPSIMYAKWNNFDGKPISEKPLFYQGITEKDAELMAKLSEEIIKIIENVEKETGLKLFKQPIYEWYKSTYGSAAGDSSNLYKIITTNPSYDGLTHPMIEVKEKDKNDDEKQKDKKQYLPNYNYRYLAQDIPYGLLVIRGFSLILDAKFKVEVPLIDKILKWAQKVQNREYFKYNDDGTITPGKDINRTRAPQRYNIKSVKDLL